MSAPEPTPPEPGAANTASDVGARGLLRHARNYVTAGAITALAGMVTVPILSRLLTVEEFGSLSIFQSMVSVFAIALGLNFHGALSRYYLERTADFPDYLRTILSFLGVVMVVELLIAYLVREPLGALFEVSGALLFAAMLMSAAVTVWNLNWKLLVSKLQSGAYAKLNAARAVAQPTLGIACVVALLLWQTGGELRYADEREALPFDLHWGQIAGLLAVSTVFALVLGRRLWAIARAGRFHAKHLRYTLAFAIPLMPHTLSGYVLNLFDVLIINMVVGAEPAGLYSFAYAIGAIMNSVVSATNQAWLPVFTDHRAAERYAKIARLAAGQTRYVCCFAVLIVLFSEEIAFVLADARYHTALPLVPVVVFGYAALFLYTLYANHSFYLRRTGLVSLATLLAGALNIVLNFWLIPLYGIAAAAWTTLISYLSLLGLHYITARFVLREQVVPLWRVLPAYLLAAGVSAGYVLASMALDGYWLTLVAVKLPIAAGAGYVAWRTRRAGDEDDAGERQATEPQARADTEEEPR